MKNGKIFAWKIRAVYAGMVCFAILLISYRPHEDFRIACLDVGQGDGIVVEIEKQMEYPLIDRGQYGIRMNWGKYQLLPYLKSTEEFPDWTEFMFLTQMKIISAGGCGNFWNLLRKI